MKARNITYQYKVEKLPAWIEKLVVDKATRQKEWEQECNQMRVQKSTK